MKAPRWITRVEVDAFHDEAIATFGGMGGVRDGALIDSALARPQNFRVYEASDLPSLAAEYAFGLAKNHGYVDGNKRTALITCAVFLILNGRQLVTPEAEAEQAILDLATDTMSKDAFAEWVRKHSRRLSRSKSVG